VKWLLISFLNSTAKHCLNLSYKLTMRGLLTEEEAMYLAEQGLIEEASDEEDNLIHLDLYR
jgi:hypothetical protein